MLRIYAILPILLALFACTPEAVKKEAEPANGTAALSAPVAFVHAETVNLRSDYSTNAEVIRQLKDGERVIIERNVNGWYQVQTGESGHTGWVRSDLVGPRHLSRTKMAAAFVDSILPAFNAEMFFDKEDLYKTIYLRLDSDFYESEQKAEARARKTGRAYQEKVFPGAIEIRVLEKNTDDLFLTLNLDKIGNAGVPVPIVQTGRLVGLLEKNYQVKVFVAVPDSVSREALLETARRISATYAIPYTKAEVYLATDNTAGLRYLKNKDYKPEDSSICRLYYLEDKNGEYFKYNYCK